MKLSVWSSYFIDLTPEQMVEEFEKHGYRYCELSDEHALQLMERGNVSEVGRKFKEFADKHNVTFLQGHMLLRVKICNKESLDFLKTQLDLFKAVGIKNAVLHCDEMENSPELSIDELRACNAESLKILLDYIKGTDIVICLENLRTNRIAKTAEDLLYFINELKSPNLGICLDTGHLNITKPDQVHFIRTAGKHIKALHIADNEGVEDQHIMPFGRGSVDVTTVISEMKKLDYQGLYNLEIPGENRSCLEIRKLKLDYIKNVFEYLDTVCR